MRLSRIRVHFILILTALLTACEAATVSSINKQGESTDSESKAPEWLLGKWTADTVYVYYSDGRVGKTTNNLSWTIGEDSVSIVESVPGSEHIYESNRHFPCEFSPDQIILIVNLPMEESPSREYYEYQQISKNEMNLIYHSVGIELIMHFNREEYH